VFVFQYGIAILGGRVKSNTVIKLNNVGAVMKTFSYILNISVALLIISCNEQSTNPDKEFVLPEFEKIGATNVPRQSSSLTFYDSEIFIVMNDIAPNNSGYLTKSIDGGFNWDLIQSFSNNIRGFGSINNELFMIRGASYFLSSDKGSTWNELFVIPSANLITSCSFSQNGFIYVSTDNGIFVSKDNGTTLIQISDSTFFVYVSENQDGTLYAIDYDSNLWKADGTNYEWNQITNGIAVEAIYFISSNELIIGTFRNGILKSNDAGSQWINYGFENYKVSHLSKMSEGFIICRASLGDTDIDLYLSLNDGKTWNKLGVEKIINTFGLSPSNYLYLVESNGVVYKSKSSMF
jgi:photosystem II stability/assembly factor-like uncharacterized protein